MIRLRLIADDLTGTLDTAAGFTGLCGPIPVAWPEILPGDGSGCLAIDSGTREVSATEADRIVQDLAPRLRGADIAFKKVDSLLRGPWAAELAAVMRLGAWPRCIVAPAFPYQGRRTANGRQLARRDGMWEAVSGDIAEALRDAGLPARRAALTDGPVAGVAVYDASHDDDLARIAELGRELPVLWCGSGGLAAALARGVTAPGGDRLVGPVLGLFGSDRPETAAQLDACGPHCLVLSPEAADHAEPVGERLARDGVVLASLALPAGTAREAAAARIAATFTNVIERIPRPGTLLVAGGETLKALCLALRVERLDVTGQIAPGLPRSTLRGGRWDGLAVISKSGAFGTEGVWRDLLQSNGFTPDRSDA
ncbi:four-carbon acid sugar kinase family protein [Methylobacterium sp. J-088]|uniref:four-carbon acid sugar kinase family protein n=1 Tax=unclassified Methylobacterium TaxID=2615210 RepID=UPI001FB9101E|nr:MULTISPECIES: four-carbon acid sugar kinase family protein [unclassified Methylobacterium]MCJ2063653.1 four-carbon acid sugar kinase family protein [Methylobacterium sp. J-088]